MRSECFFIKSNFNFGGGLISGVRKRENWGIIGAAGASGELIRALGRLDRILEGYQRVSPCLAYFRRYCSIGRTRLWKERSFGRRCFTKF